MSEKKWFNRHLKVINHVLLGLIIIVNGYVLITPFLPQVTYQVQTAFSEPVSVATPDERLDIDRTYDHLVIPKMRLDEKIWIGDSEWLVNKGVWHIPHSSTPDQGSNTVLVGHRFSYKDPAVFYHIDKLAVNDTVVVAWGGKIYTYKVKESKIVNPTDIYVEDATEEDILTLYSCYPLWSTRQRIVVTTSLESVE